MPTGGAAIPLLQASTRRGGTATSVSASLKTSLMYGRKGDGWTTMTVYTRSYRAPWRLEVTSIPALRVLEYPAAY